MTFATCFTAVLFGLLSPQDKPAEEDSEKACPFQESSPEVERLVEDLGADTAEKREKAARRLEDLGEEAVPKLKSAAYDRDAERAMAARRILLSTEARLRSGKGDRQERHPPPLMAAVFYDWGRGVFFQMEPSGKVELTMPVKNEQTGKREFRRFRAPSLEELRKNHPEAAREVDLSGKAPSQDTREWWSRTEKWLSLESEEDSETEARDGKTDGQYLEAWRVRHRSILDEFLKRWRDQKPEDDRLSAFGALVGTPDPSLRAHLGLDADGVLVLEVREDSPAGKAGLRKHDVITRVAGEAVGDLRDFSREMTRALKAGEFSLEIRRQGKDLEVSVDQKDK